MKINRYNDMLKSKYREFITPSKCENLNELINWARDREIEKKRQEECGEKRQVEKGSTQGTPKMSKTHDQGKKETTKGGFPRCKTREKFHSGECLMGKKGCYNCGQEWHPYYNCPNPKRVCYNCNESGHVKAECLELKQGMKKEGKKEEPSKAKGRMFQISSEEARAHPNVVSEVEIADCKSYLLHEICRNCKITIEDEDFDIDLILMVLGEFKGRWVSIYGEREVETKLCTIIEAVKYVRNGSKAFLAYVVDTKQDALRIEDTRIVDEYPDVFPDELSGLPPEREVEF
ncbi:uncharacterized protein LOC110893175 [Helianthus annuus]|uniref:uncharacterized protein LOC110893175 n=1 Tax=Helianthus annuus TaxID=4232 RepID=UPI000B8F970E|nr:uncharacterized protein LOC110893175 [Helianthus annuus]